jgi:hypothetical protein
VHSTTSCICVFLASCIRQQAVFARRSMTTMNYNSISL